MGVPSFFRWLVQRFSRVVVDVVEEEPQLVDGVEVPVDSSKPNPNSMEFDNLYLDMNGIIHPCSHPQSGPQPKSEDEIMVKIMEAIDRLFRIVRPRKLLYMAIDGVAPRAKMNQQRSRRFRAAKEAKDKREAEERIRKELEAEGRSVPPLEEKMHFDSNCITPGTAFMEKVAESLQFYVNQRVLSDPGWRGVKVILSDSNVPGEGEHKIMEYIRHQRSQPDYNPNQKHCIYGLDADLIMLGLSTHEPNFSILREIVTFASDNCYVCGQPGHVASECKGEPKKKEDEPPKKTPYQFLHISILREYLEQKLKVETPFPFSLERAIDDWVFLCFFVGNDFLPHLPTLDIREGAIDMLTNLYRKILPRTEYITENGQVNMERLSVLITEISQMEESILEKRFLKAQRRKDERKRKRAALRAEEQALQNNANTANQLRALLTGDSEVPETPEQPPHKRLRTKDNDNNHDQTSFSNGKSTFSASPSTEKPSSILSATTPPEKPLNQSLDISMGDDDDEDVPDPVRLGGDSGWKERYYKLKFGADISDTDYLKGIGKEYIIGLVWVFKYYYSGCPSWNWYYPFHYAPFTTEMTSFSDLQIDFTLGTPFKPLSQLMAVLPAASAQFVPKRYQDLMTDPDSPIIEFYPEDFLVDLNGKKQQWLGVALLPFIVENKLLEALGGVESSLTDEERYRNRMDKDILFVHEKHSLAAVMLELYSGKGIKEITIPVEASGGLAGILFGWDANIALGEEYPSPVSELLPSIPKCCTVGAKYDNPPFPDSGLLRGLHKEAVLPPKILNAEDHYRPRGPRRDYYDHQNSAANRMINHYTGGGQYKPGQYGPQDANERNQRYDRDDRYNRKDRYERNRNDDRYNRNDRYHNRDERYERQERYDRDDRNDRYDKNERNDRYNRNDNRYDRYEDRGDNRSYRDDRYRNDNRNNSYDKRSYDNRNGNVPQSNLPFTSQPMGFIPPFIPQQPIIAPGLGSAPVLNQLFIPQALPYQLSVINPATGYGLPVLQQVMQHGVNPQAPVMPPTNNDPRRNQNNWDNRGGNQGRGGYHNRRY